VLYRPRQWGETTFARQVAGTTKAEYFDLKYPVSQRRRSEPMLALRDLRGLVIVDEVLRQPESFPVLRVLADRKPLLARFLILGLKSGMACTGQHYIDACCPFRFGSRTTVRGVSGAGMLPAGQQNGSSGACEDTRASAKFSGFDPLGLEPARAVIC
jgi:hypothetical protein